MFDMLMSTKSRYVLFETSNPRHGHAWTTFRDCKSNIVDADRVIAGSGCGFGTFAGFGAVEPDIGYAKLSALSEGAALIR